MLAVTGAAGKIGIELVRDLRLQFGNELVLSIWNKTPLPNDLLNTGPHEQLDLTDFEALKNILIKYKVTVIYHLAAVLSAAGESDLFKCWDSNMKSLLNVLTLARDLSLQKVFWASSVAAFGPSAPKDLAPQECYMDPISMYGVTKVSGELLCQYFHHKFNVDVRGLRFVAILTADAGPSGGSIDYALLMFHWARKNGAEPYKCYLQKSTKVPWLHMHDTIRSIHLLMSAPAERIKIRTAYNIAAVSFTVEELEKCIQKRYNNFRVQYPSPGDQVDVRQKIVESLPIALDDTKAVEDWDWKPQLDLDGMTNEMFNRMDEIYKNE